MPTTRCSNCRYKLASSASRGMTSRTNSLRQEREERTQLAANTHEDHRVDIVAHGNLLQLAVFSGVDDLADGLPVRHAAEVGGRTVESPAHSELSQHEGVNRRIVQGGQWRQVADREAVVLGAADGEDDVGALAELLDDGDCGLALLDLLSEAILVPGCG